MVTKNQNSQEGAVLGFWISVRPSILNQIGKVEKKEFGNSVVKTSRSCWEH